MPTFEARVTAAARAAHFAVCEAIGEARFAVSLSTRLYVHREAPVTEEYLIAALQGLYEVRDVLDQALPPAAPTEERDG